MGAGTVTATFYNFNPVLVARHVPDVWSVATPEQVIEARWRAADATLRRVLGEEAIASAEMAEAARLALRPPSLHPVRPAALRGPRRAAGAR